MVLNLNLLSWIIFLPVIGLVVIALMPKQGERTVKWVALVAALAAFILSIAVLWMFDRSSASIGLMQFEEKIPWIPAINSYYHLGVDGLSLPLVILMTFLGVVSVLVSWKIQLKPRQYFMWILLLESSILGVFCSLDLILFFLFWELELIPMFFLISLWGSGRKEYAAYKYLIYTLVGSAFMLAGILCTYFITHTFDISALAGIQISSSFIPLSVLFFLLMVGFAIKLPVFPLHTWLPDAHTNAPTAASVILAGALLKMGGYGMIRVCVSMLPQVAVQYAPIMCTLAVVGIIYGAAVTIRQTDLKRLIAYSSVSHMGYVLLGIFALNQVSLVGASLQMLSHGVITGLLFAMVGLVYDKTHTRDINNLSGLARQMPVIAVVFSLAGLASLGLPGTAGFAAEFITFAGSFASVTIAGMKIFTLIAVIGVVITSGYILWMIQRVFYGYPLEKYNGVGDADTVEMVSTFSFVAVIMAVGIYPAMLSNVINMGIIPIAKLIGI
jgi:NADH-quinone oxidoreductase subunit M